MSWSDAKRRGDKYYYGKVCMWHPSLEGLRRTKTGECMGCRVEHSEEFFRKQRIERSRRRGW